MQSYDIITLNASRLGQDLFDSFASSTASSSSASASATSFLSGLREDISDARHRVVDELRDKVDDVTAALADRVTEKLGIEEWYGLHLMTLCEGSYNPNGTAPGADKNVTECTKAKSMFDFNITARLEEQLSFGPFDITLEDIGYPADDIDDGIRLLNIALHAMFVLYCIGIAFSGISILLTLAFLFTTGPRLLSVLSWIVALIAMLAYLIGSIVITVLQDRGTSRINKYGNPIGLYAQNGKRFLAITWAATAMVIVLLLVWTIFFLRGRKERGGVGEKRSGKPGLVHRLRYRISTRRAKDVSQDDVEMR